MKDGFFRTDHSANLVCLRMEYQGEVQGVGFRFTTNSIAKRYPVVGFVQNCPNGRVLLVLQGKRSDIDKVLYEIELYFADQIEDKFQTEEPLREDLTQFNIYY